MKYIWGLITALVMTVLGMMGGQGKIGGKATRRFGLPSIATIFAWFSGLGWRALAFLLWIPLLSMGYGQDSHLFNWLFQSDILTRIVYGALVAIPYFVFGLTKGIICAIILMFAFVIRAGSLGTISWFGDILIEDIIRYTTMGVLLIGNCLLLQLRKKD